MMKLEYPYGYFCTYKAILCWEGYRLGCKGCLKNILSNSKDEVKDWTKEIKESRTVVGTS